MNAFEKTILISGSERHVGKTFWSELLVRAIAPIQCVQYLKITNHFHAPTSGLKLIKETPTWRLFEEHNAIGEKDSQRVLYAGATISLYAQVLPDAMQDFINQIHAFIDINKILLVESYSFGNFIQPELAFFIDGGEGKSCMWNFNYQRIFSQNSRLIHPPTTIFFDNREWKLEF